MLGLFLVSGSDAAMASGLAMAQSGSSHSAWHLETRAGADYVLGVVSMEGNRIWQSEDARYVCAVDGWVTGTGPGGKKSLPEFTRAVVESGVNGAMKFNGEFTAAVLDTRAGRCTIVNDRFARRTIYMHVRNGCFCLSTDLHSLIENGLLVPSLNKPYVSSLLRLNKVRPGTSTLFADVETLRPGSWVEVELGVRPVVRQSLYYRHVFSNEKPLEPDWGKRFVHCLQSAIDRSMSRADGAVGLTLSGGLDSRLLLAAATEDQRRGLVAASYGKPDSMEAQVAKQVATAAGVHVENIPIGPEDYLACSDMAPIVNEEYDIFVQGAQSLTNEYLARRCNYVMSGWDVDIPLRGTYLTNELLSMDDAGQVPDVIFEKWGLFSRGELRHLLKPEFFGNYVDSADDLVRTALDQVPEGTPVKKYLGFLFLFEKQRLLMLRSRVIRNHLETLTPLYDEEVQDMLSTVPETEKFQNRLFQRVFSELAPELLSIIYQRTSLPGNVDPSYWADGVDVESRRERLYRRIYLETGQLVEYKRFYSNFAQWLMCEPGWRSFVDDMFIRKDAAIYEEIAERDYVRELIERDRRSEVSEFTKIVHLVSLELYLRKYFC